jgi:hypothetical protein
MVLVAVQSFDLIIVGVKNKMGIVFKEKIYFFLEVQTPIVYS